MVEAAAQEYRWTPIGGHPALELCNTRSWRLDPARSVDRIDTPGRFADWYAQVIEAAAPDPAATPPEPSGERHGEAVDLASVHRLRDAAIAVLDAHLAGEAAPTGALRTVTAAWRAALAGARPGARLPLTWTIDTTARQLELHRLALAVADLLHGSDLDLLRRCDGAGCGWLFFDRTRNHSRRWCDPDDCGNRARVRAYSRRRRLAGGTKRDVG